MQPTVIIIRLLSSVEEVPLRLIAPTPHLEKRAAFVTGRCILYTDRGCTYCTAVCASRRMVIYAACTELPD